MGCRTNVRARIKPFRQAWKHPPSGFLTANIEDPLNGAQIELSDEKNIHQSGRKQKNEGNMAAS